MTAIIIFAIWFLFFLALAIIYTVCGDSFSDTSVLAGSWFITGGLLIALIWSICSYSEPTAMDVYQGKTELQYTVKGTEVVDSVVVFKDK